MTVCTAGFRGRTILLATLVSIITTPTALLAQSNTPYGSPLDPNSQQYNSNNSQNGNNGNYGNSGNNSYNYSNMSSRIEPVDVNGNSSNSANNNNSMGNGSQNGYNQPPLGYESVVKKPAPPNEYEKFVESVIGKKLPRFGADLLVPATRDFAAPATATVPPAYILNPGDQILIGLSGSIDGTIDAVIDNNGRIFIPKVGPIRLGGVAYGDLKSVLTRAIGTQYRDFRLSVSVTKLRGIRVYVTGFANNPGAYSVNSLSTMANAVLAAGGPAAGGSFRQIKLYRNGELVSDFDLYDLIRRGDRSKDSVLQNEDVLYIPPVGAQVALTGSVNQEAIYEAKPGEAISALLNYAGGATSLADPSRVILYRLADRGTVGGVEVPRASLASTRVTPGDIIQLLSVGSLAQPLERQAVVVRVEGEVNRPGNYYVPPNTSLSAVMAMAGGLTSNAFIYGTNFQRVSVRQQQQQSFQEAINQLEISLAAAPLTKDSSIDAATGDAQVASARTVLDRLRKAEPDGRVVLDIRPNSLALPGSLLLENNDRIYVPPRPTTIGVFGAVYRPASFMIPANPQTVGKYLDQAGGPIRAGDRGQTFVVRANGAVISKNKGALNQKAMPGDVIFVPVKTQTTTLLGKIQQISTIFLQLGLTAAAFVALTN